MLDASHLDLERHRFTYHVGARQGIDPNVLWCNICNHYWFTARTVVAGIVDCLNPEALHEHRRTSLDISVAGNLDLTELGHHLFIGDSLHLPPNSIIMQELQ